ncbi:hypothetical protein PQX77_015486 [Marasmius sp. AFHP31]|nr:hypothetical protein PQX77_015486 [Marasmius sp. AFHP31]
MSGPANGPYYIQNVKTKKFAIAGSNNFIDTSAANHAVFDIALVPGQDVYVITERRTGHDVGAESTGKPRKVLLQLSAYEWTIKAAGTGAWNIGIKLDNLWWDDLSNNGDCHKTGVVLRDGTSDETAWQLMAAPRDA